MIWASALRLFFSRNLLDRAGEKIPLMNAANRGGGYPPISTRGGSPTFNPPRQISRPRRCATRARKTTFRAPRRCRRWPARTPHNPRTRTALLATLEDQDPNLRTDAMTALELIAPPEDAPAILRSLTGDPVREMKLFALHALTRLGPDAAALAHIRALVLTRCEDDVAWEDDGAVWENWLDIQIAAIDALGRMGAAQAIPDLLAAGRRIRPDAGRAGLCRLRADGRRRGRATAGRRAGAGRSGPQTGA
jgi:hypothetical protein